MAGSRGSISFSLVCALPFFVLVSFSGTPLHILTKWPQAGSGLPGP